MLHDSLVHGHKHGLLPTPPLPEDIGPVDLTENARKVLVVAPLSGHHATLLRDTVRTLLAEHDVWITDWVNARTAPARSARSKAFSPMRVNASARCASVRLVRFFSGRDSK